MAIERPDPGHSPPTEPGTIEPAERRSAWPVVFGVIGILVAGIELLAATCFGTALLGFGLSTLAGGPERLSRTPAYTGTHLTIEFIHLGLLVLLSIVLLIASVGLLRRRPAAPRLAARWAMLRILLAGLHAASAILVVSFGAADARGYVDAEETIGALLVVYLPVLAASIAFPILMLLWLSRGRVGDDIARWA